MHKQILLRAPLFAAVILFGLVGLGGTTHRVHGATGATFSHSIIPIHSPLTERGEGSPGAAIMPTTAAGPIGMPGTDPNPILNPSLEVATDEGDNPMGWHFGSWGSNDATPLYPIAGSDSSSAASLIIEQFNSGDAKWYFDDIPVETGRQYYFSDDYKSDARSYVTVRFTLMDGSHSYHDIAILPPSDSWASFTASFGVPVNVETLTVFHLIKSVGTLTTDNYELAPAPSFPMGMVSLVFDDGWKDTYEQAIPLLDSFGFKSTHYVSTGRFEFPSYVSEEDVLMMAAGGHEIGAQGRTNTDLTMLMPSEQHDEIYGSYQDLTDIGIDVSSFSYPWGGYTYKLVDMVSDAGFMSAHQAFPGSNIAAGNPMLIRIRSVDSTVSSFDVQEWVENALEEKQWLVLRFSRVNDVADGPYISSTSQLKRILNQLKENDIKVVTVSEATDEMALLTP